MTDIVDRLRTWAGYKVGDAIPMPNGSNTWGPVLAADLRDAIAEIEGLRANADEKYEGPIKRQTGSTV